MVTLASSKHTHPPSLSLLSPTDGEDRVAAQSITLSNEKLSCSPESGGRREAARREGKWFGNRGNVNQSSVK